MQRHLIQHLDDAVTEVFALALNLACTSQEAGPVSRCTLPAASGITAFVGFSGSIEGVCTIQVNQCTAAELTSNMMAIPRHEVLPELCVDAIGELCNMIAGGWKTRQPEHRAFCKLTCPTVTIGALDPPTAAFTHSATVSYYFAGHHLTLHLTCN